MLEKRHLFGRPDTKPLLEFRRDILELKSGTRRDANGHSALGTATAMVMGWPHYREYIDNRPPPKAAR